MSIGSPLAPRHATQQEAARSYPAPSRFISRFLGAGGTGIEPATCAFGDPIRRVRRHSRYVTECRSSDVLPRKVFVSCRQVSPWVVGIGGATGGISQARSLV